MPGTYQAVYFLKLPFISVEQPVKTRLEFNVLIFRACYINTSPGIGIKNLDILH
tara:strand:- start:213 stop:374 length:162 start_codon:yes stop_codon:yes gene_type:complete